MDKVITKRWILIFVLLFFICAAIMTFYYFLFQEKHFDFKNKETVISEEKYEIKVNYPVFTNNKLSKSVITMLDGQKKTFINEVESYDSDEVYKMNSEYNYTVHENLYSFHYRTYYFVDNAHFHREDEIKYVDSSNNTELNIEDLVTDKTEFYNRCAFLVKDYIEKNELDIYKSEEKINAALEVNDENYKLITFSNDSMHILFAPYKLNDEKEIDIPIEYLKVKKYLNTDYFDIEGDFDEVIRQEEAEAAEKERIRLEEEKKKQEEERKRQEEEKKKQEEAKKKQQSSSGNLKSTNNGSVDKMQPQVRDASYFEGKKLICFTFDDGPNAKTTTKLLDGLKERNVKATFFVVGNRVAGNADIIRRMYNEGHTIGQHSWSHQSLKKLGETAAKNEIYQANDAIKNVIGYNPRYIRPPYGAYNSDTLTYADMVFINWSVDPLDWKYKNADTVYNNIIKVAKDGDIVLVHDLYETSVDGALKAMDYLATQGFAFVSIDEMIQYRGITLEEHHLYNKFR